MFNFECRLQQLFYKLTFLNYGEWSSVRNLYFTEVFMKRL